MHDHYHLHSEAEILAAYEGADADDYDWGCTPQDVWLDRLARETAARRAAHAAAKKPVLQLVPPLPEEKPSPEAKPAGRPLLRLVNATKRHSGLATLAVAVMYAEQSVRLLRGIERTDTHKYIARLERVIKQLRS